jgi:hypothetical protein
MLVQQIIARVLYVLNHLSTYLILQIDLILTCNIDCDSNYIFKVDITFPVNYFGIFPDC